MEVQQELKEASSKCEALEQKAKYQVTGQMKLSAELLSVRVERRFYEEEVRQAKLMANGKPYLVQCAFGGNRCAFLTRIWRSTDAFTNLPQSAADATKYFATHDGDTEQWLFWAQFESPEPNPSLSYQMKQLLKLQRIAEPAMKDLFVPMWPTKPLPNSYFALVRKLIDASPQIEQLQRSACIEGARMAFARTMVHLPGVKPLKMAIDLPPIRKEHWFPRAVLLFRHGRCLGDQIPMLQECNIIIDIW
ncbi:hypothetical protein ZWY2020_024261 [Hordeum vulgare]|nr:hypothetical protein ZWY2020_024261 [Hordeum vulgare]